MSDAPPAPAAFDLALRAFGIIGSGAFFGERPKDPGRGDFTAYMLLRYGALSPLAGLTLSTSTALVPIIQRHKTLSMRQRLELWDDQFTLSVGRWTPFGIVGALCLLWAAYRCPPQGVALGASAYDSRRTLLLSGCGLLAMIPMTVVLIFPTVFKLKGELRKAPEYAASETQVRALIRKWDRRHWLRIGCSLVCFASAIYDLCRIAAR